MLLKILQILKESISSVTGVTPWEMTMKHTSKQELMDMLPQAQYAQEKLSPKFSVGDLVKTKETTNETLKEENIGIIVGVIINDSQIFNAVFYEVYFGENKRTLMETWLYEYKEEKIK